MASGAGELAYLTGATGFIGGRLAAALVERGYRIRCLVRRPESAGALKALGAELIQGDVADESSHDRGLDGATLAWHVAGMYDIGAVDVTAMERTNITGTAAFLAALARSSVRHAVHVSTTVVLAPAPAGATEGDPDTPMKAPFPTDYQRTKAAAHALALEAQRAGAPLSIVCPSYVYGPGDTGPAGRYVADVLRHRVPGLSRTPTWFSFAYVDDVVDGLLEAGVRGRAGVTYVLSGEHCDVNTFSDRVAKAGGTWGPPLRLPGAAVRLTGRLFDVIGRFTKRRLPISREVAALAASGDRYTHPYSKAAQELGYEPRMLDEGLPGTVRDAQARLAG